MIKGDNSINLFLDRLTKKSAFIGQRKDAQRSVHEPSRCNFNGFDFFFLICHFLMHGISVILTHIFPPSNLILNVGERATYYKQVAKNIQNFTSLQASQILISTKFRSY